MERVLRAYPTSKDGRYEIRAMKQGKKKSGSGFEEILKKECDALSNQMK